MNTQETDSLHSEATENVAPSQSFDPRMLEALICPVSHNVLSYDANAQELVSKTARVAFPIRDGIPVMLVSEARNIE